MGYLKLLARKRKFKLFCCFTLVASCTVYTIVLSFKLLHSYATKTGLTSFKTIGDQSRESFKSRTAIENRVHIFNASNESRKIREKVLKYQCVPFNTSEQESKICVYPPNEDVWVSKFIIQGEMWEPDLLSLTETLMEGHPGMTLLDLGCHIGVFTLYLARRGRRVVSVDANMFNLMLLSRSLDIGNLHRKVTLIWNAVSDTRENITLKAVPRNIGAWNIHTGIEMNTDEVLEAITLDDISFLFGHEKVFIKMDIEESELKALTGGKEFFKQVNVEYVLMEFAWHRTGQSGKHICDIMSGHGFRAFPTSLGQIPLDVLKYSEWPANVLWTKH